VTPDPSSLVSTDWLADHLHDPDLRIVDVRWRVRYEDGRGISFDDPDEYRAGHIPGAAFVGMVGELSDPSHPVPDMPAPPDRFAAAMSRLGIGEQLVSSGRSFRFSAPEVLAALYRAAGVAPDPPVITYCGRGFVASCGLLALKAIGCEDARLYDGSWAEWSADPSLPAEVSRT
jgi:thiosulfate/3-mercaptopyruvate sulfurtransferase